MKKSLNNPTNFFLFIAISAIVSWGLYKYAFSAETLQTFGTLMPTFLGVFIAIIPFLAIDVVNGHKAKSGKLTKKDGLPDGIEVNYQQAIQLPKVTNDELGTTVDFGGGNILIIKPNRNVTLVLKPYQVKVDVVDLNQV